MEFRALRLLTLLGLLFVEPGFGQRGDMDVGEWLREKAELLNAFGDKLKDVRALEARLNATVDQLTGQKAEVDRLREENEGSTRAPRVAFSASLADFGEIYKGPCTDKTLIYKRVFSNTGDGYDQSTGVFTAPVCGLYFFSFSTYGYNTHVTGAILMKNGARQVSTYDGLAADGSDGAGNAVALQLVAGDAVHMELWDGGRVFDNLNGHTTFSGFLVFPA
uniref:C1q domain-containing protein n=1 Tax=Cyclopterus lumpus TaxID=8103 RepID=A0A8C2XD96_CYCLU